MELQSIRALLGATTEHISILPEHVLHLDFSTTGASFDRTDNSLVISFDGGTVIVDDFFVVEGEELPTLVLADGVEISAHDFLSSMNPDMDLSTAAGPALSQGGGSHDYADAAGSLIEGLDALGSLGTWAWNSEAREPLNSLSVAGPTGASLGVATGDANTGGNEGGGTEGGGTEGGGNEGGGNEGGGNEGGGNEGGETHPPHTSYLVRAVAYSQKGDIFENNGAQFRLVDENLQPADLSGGYSITVTEGRADFFIQPAELNSDGTFTLRFSEEGKKFLEEGGLIDAIVSIEVDGHEYNMQVVGTPDGSFNSTDENIFSNAGKDVPLEWHNSPEDPSSNAPAGNKEGTLTGNNEAWLESIHGDVIVGSGDDTLHIKKSTNTDGKTHRIDMGSGNDRIELDNTLTATGAGTIHDIRFGEGVNSLTVKQGDIKASGGAENKIISAEDSDTIISLDKGNIWASEGGKNIIQTGAGKDNVTVQSSVWNTGGHNEINTGGGATDEISVGAYVYAKGNQQQGLVAENTLTTEGKISANEVYALENGRNSLRADSIKVNTNAIAKNSGAENTLEASGALTVGKDVFAENSAQNTLKGDSVSVGMNVIAKVNGAQNIVEAKDSLNVVGQVFVQNNGQNTLTGNSITVGSHANAQGSYSQNILEASDSLEVVGQAYALDGGENILKGNSVSVGSHVNAKDAHAQNTIEAAGSLNVAGQVITQNSGENSLKGKSVTVESSVSAEGSGALNTLTAEDFLSLKSGVTAKPGGANELKAGGAIDVAASVVANGGHNTIQAGAAFSGRDIQATEGGANRVEAQSIRVANSVESFFGGNNRITASESLEVANGVTSTEAGQNTLAGKTIQVGGEVRATSNDAQNSFTADETIQMKASVNAKNGANILTAGNSIVVEQRLGAENGENTLRTTGDELSTIKIGSSMQASGAKGKNSLITDNGGTDITLGGKMSATSSGMNSVQAGDGRFDLSVNGNMEAYTLGKNSVEAKNDQTGNLHIKGGMLAGDYRKEGGENSVILGDGGNTIIIDGEMKAAYKGSNTLVSGDGDDTLSVKKILSDGEGSLTTVALGAGKDEVTTQVLRASNKGTVNLDMGAGEGEVLNVPGDGSLHSFHISATGGGTLNLAKGEGDLTINTDRLQASGGTITLTGKEGSKADVTINGVIQAFSQGKVEVKGINDLSLNGTDNDGVVVYARDSSETDISANTISLKATGVEWNQQGNTKDVIGVYATSGGSNTLRVGENLDIDVSSVGRGSISPRVTHGLSASSLTRDTVSENTIIANEDAKVSIRAEATATSGESSLVGMYAYGTSIAGKAYNRIEANDVSIEVVGGKSTNAFGMYSKATGNGSVGSNTIESTADHALTVSITATTAGNSNIFDAYAVYSTGIGSENRIIGHSTADTSDRISIEGDIYTSRGANSFITGDGNDFVSVKGDLIVNSGRDGINGDGLNKISTGAGNDMVSINGDITIRNGGTVNGKGVNLIETGEGNDIVYLNGKISSAESLNLNMGTDADRNDHDILVLTAAGYDEFVEQYGAWLTSGALEGAGVEQIHINGIKQADIDRLLNYFETRVPGFEDFPEISTSLENKFFMDSVNVDDFQLSDLLGGYGSETDTILDFSGKGVAGGQANEFSLDALLKNMEKVTGIKIAGDADLDKVDVSGWNLEGSASDSEGFLTFSQNGNIIHVHESIIDQSTADEGLMSYLLNGGM